MKQVFKVLFALTITLGILPAAQACRGSGCSFLAWSGGSCGEFTRRGDLIRWVQIWDCRAAIGTMYDWSGGSCGEWTPRGDLVRWVDPSYCRAECGVVRRR